MLIEEPMPVEQWLGPAEGRYFAAGYRRVGYRLSSLSGIGDGVAFTAQAEYPVDWSLSDTGAPRSPHLSSVDAITLTVLAARELSRTSPDQGHAWVRGITLRAGPAPWTDLACIPVRIAADDPRDGRTMNATVGNIRTQVAFGSGVEATLRCPLDHEVDGYRHTVAHTTIRSLCTDTATLEAVHSFTTEGRADTVGNASQVGSALTVVDYLVTMGQLAQTLVIAVHGTNRQSMGNLWMRTMRIGTIDAPTHIPVSLATRTRITKDATIARPGARIHSLTVTSHSSDGVTGEAALAYVEQDHDDH